MSITVFLNYSTCDKGRTYEKINLENKTIVSVVMYQIIPKKMKIMTLKT